MKVLKFLLTVATLYVLLWIFFWGMDAVWTFILTLGGLYTLIVGVSIFCLLPVLLFAWIIFKW